MLIADKLTDDSYGQLSDAAQHHNIQSPRWESRPREATDESSTVFNIAMESCILCGRCAQACQDGHQFIGAIDVLGAGRDSRIGTFALIIGKERVTMQGLKEHGTSRARGYLGPPMDDYPRQSVESKVRKTCCIASFAAASRKPLTFLTSSFLNPPCKKVV